VRPMGRRKREFARFCAQVDRRCARMNNGLAAVVFVLAATTLFVGGLQVVEAVARDPQWNKLPFIEMSADSPNADPWSMGD
jgi:hypothetical protein